MYSMLSVSDIGCHFHHELLLCIRAVKTRWLALEHKELSETEAVFIGKVVCHLELGVKSNKRKTFDE